MVIFLIFANLTKIIVTIKRQKMTMLYKKLKLIIFKNGKKNSKKLLMRCQQQGSVSLHQIVAHDVTCCYHYEPES